MTSLFDREVSVVFNSIARTLTFHTGAKKKDIGLVEANRIINELESEEKKRERDILPILKRIIGKYRDLTERMDMTFELYQNQCKVYGGSLLDELFSHVIENAIIHSDGRRVRVSMKTEKDKVVIIVEDDGKGVPDSKKKRIFEKFWSEDKERCSGLGLYLAKLIVESYGGWIEVKDSELGGARFDVQLRRSKRKNKK